VISLEGGRLLVSGGLTMDTVPALFAEGLPYLTQENLVLDFAQIVAVDSSAVSLLLGWLRAAQQKNCELRVVNLPSSLSSLASLYGVSEMLPAQAV
jgi:phospholipid transport system transporter-binding protein